MLQENVFFRTYCAHNAEGYCSTRNVVPTSSGGESVALLCRVCKVNYPIIAGVPYFAMHLGEQDQTAASYGFQWQAYRKGLFDKKDVFGLKFSETANSFLNSLGLQE